MCKSGSASFFRQPSSCASLCPVSVGHSPFVTGSKFYSHNRKNHTADRHCTRGQVHITFATPSSAAPGAAANKAGEKTATICTERSYLISLGVGVQTWQLGRVGSRCTLLPQTGARHEIAQCNAQGHALAPEAAPTYPKGIAAAGVWVVVVAWKNPVQCLHTRVVVVVLQQIPA